MWEACNPPLLTLYYFLHLPHDVKSRKICHLLLVRMLSSWGSGPQQLCDRGRDVNPVQRKHSTRPWRSRSPFPQTLSCNQSEGETWNLEIFWQSSAFNVGKRGIPQKEQFPSDGPASPRLPRSNDEIHLDIEIGSPKAALTLGMGKRRKWIAFAQGF